MGSAITSERLCACAAATTAVTLRRYSISDRSNGQSKLELCTSRRIPGNPQSPAVRLNNRSANRQSHPHSLAFAREERLEDALQCFRFDSRAGVLDSNNTF